MDNDQHLITATLRGDQASFRVLVERYQDYVFTVANKVLRNREEAEEAAQDTFVKAYRALAGFEQRSRFSTWLYQIAWRAAIDRQRLKKLNSQSIDDNNSFLQIGDREPTPEEHLQQKNTKALVHHALSQMKPEDASLLAFYYLQEQSVKEISEITGLTESNIKVKLFRLRDALKNHLAKQLKTEVKDLL
ncbi:MAG: sigma-70 family RNA polymerase sigma factor [Lewinellaceae bacterium]|nr:sigma-70 family RNA polymerase sigma factor [Lewinellaceae bacterium]